jgi:uncharacterized protein (DUF302 family)
MTIIPNTRSFLLVRIVLLSLLLSACAEPTPDRLYQQNSPYPFEETIQYLDIAISEHNYRIIHRSEIGQAIRDRGEKDFPLSTIISFCNITYAHEMILIDPKLLNDMPCIIVVREEDEQVIVSTKLMETEVQNPKQREFATKINNNLLSIISSTVE